jgi:hypothetical protein
MASYIRQRPPAWFVVVAILLVLWGLAGCYSFYLHVLYGVAMVPNGGAWERAYDARLPGWFLYVFAVSVGAGLLGSLALLTRSRLATPLYILSLIAVIVQFGYVFIATDMIAHQGAATAVPFPLFIAAVAAFQIWFAKRAERRGWIS